ncbi:TetR/AcrR family transcriptional regulator [Sphingobium phenoxybenzoativorans]|uniref:TetR/AcrR family transcriptional regulator n=1 Tax=Sphingobium phenoxybenzoativorans TaxID=1592790 RepID=UPI0008727312|nr:hypothetical protein [Sphingobium phenoxybenzoativorans]
MTELAFSEPKRSEDHRTRAARTKRTRTRAQILDAVLATYPGESLSSPAVVDDILNVAKLSRATFYKYFTSLEQAVEELGAQLADELTVSYALIYEDLVDPKLRAATGFQLFLSRAAIDRHWGSFVSHAQFLSRDAGTLRQIAMDLNAGIASGDFKISDLDTAIDLIMGAKAEAIRQLTRAPRSRRYIEHMATMILQSLCVSPADAETATRDASERLHLHAPARLTWWQPFD